MTIFTRKRLIVAALVAAFLVVISVIAAVSKSSPTAAPTVAVAPAAGGVPSSLWYWTMAVSPKDPNVLVLGTANGLYRSADGGKTWAPTGPKSVNETSLVEAGDTMYAGGVHVTPTTSAVIRKGTARAASDGPAVLSSSTDGGVTWQTLQPKGLPSVSIQSLATDPSNTSSLYALTNTGKLYRSIDSAKTFQLFDAKLGIAPWAIAITQGNQFVSGDMDSGPHTSANGKSWTPTPYTDLRKGKMVMEYAVQPDAPNHVLMTSIGIESSTDGGKTWHPALKSQTMFGPVAWAASSPKIAYAIDFDSILWRSADSGKTWKKV
ncbi:MAG TPA: hypothetical protein VGM80_15205 [Gaiellaceae bacterium]|jgi:photosystem II stability/assembly factor-like uncharacterized protein